MGTNKKSNAIIKTAFGVLIGAAIGTAVGLLVAPKKGSKTRRDIKHGISDAGHDVSDWITHTKDDIVKAAKDKKKAFDKKMG